MESGRVLDDDDPGAGFGFLATRWSAPRWPVQHVPLAAVTFAPRTQHFSAPICGLPSDRRLGDNGHDLRPEQLLGMERHDLLLNGRRRYGGPWPCNAAAGHLKPPAATRRL